MVSPTQGALLPPTDRELLAEAARLLDAVLTKAGPGGRHLPTCRIGQWVDGHSAPDGAPCSARCAAIRAWLSAEVRQHALFEAEG